MDQVKNVIHRLKSDYELAMRDDTSTMFNNLSSTFYKSENVLREFIQSELANDIKLIIAKLNSRNNLDYKEVLQIRRMLVSEAEYYSKWENNYQDWMAELNRLMHEIDATMLYRIDVEMAEKLRVLTKDARRVVDEIIYFQEQQERIRRLDDATRDIDLDECIVVADLLHGQLECAEH